MMIDNNADNKTAIVDILLSHLSYVYCDNCDNGSDWDKCDDCHRKYMNWKLSHYCAEKMADEIIKLFSKKETEQCSNCQEFDCNGCEYNSSNKE